MLQHLTAQNSREWSQKEKLSSRIVSTFNYKTCLISPSSTETSLFGCMLGEGKGVGDISEHAIWSTAFFHLFFEAVGGIMS